MTRITKSDRIRRYTRGWCDCYQCVGNITARFSKREVAAIVEPFDELRTSYLGQFATDWRDLYVDRYDDGFGDDFDDPWESLAYDFDLYDRFYAPYRPLVVSFLEAL